VNNVQAAIHRCGKIRRWGLCKSKYITSSSTLSISNEIVFTPSLGTEVELPTKGLPSVVFEGCFANQRSMVASESSK
jgi:hypothetical protein